ncbi:hypothetical protein BTN49_0305 (plasmid) [Candidatus Enterovibrio escicola]|uniref:Uncharacterized protein n=1 Tax=Candidatus Enterovibrio escicola TaxID=1927127 RepID=A0A2A5T1R3_9GAMM|nr:hypothetical protein BTN49_2274 [Candidatus Enterovibrio escacola]PCS23939.1 hypothetical protein BTN49_0305 [Candidatus Enterovibrio escacola]
MASSIHNALRGKINPPYTLETTQSENDWILKINRNARQSDQYIH